MSIILTGDRGLLARVVLGHLIVLLVSHSNCKYASYMGLLNYFTLILILIEY